MKVVLTWRQAKIQNKLHCWAGADRARRFDDLYNLVCDLNVLTMAWQRVAGNKGARTAGVDRADGAWIESRYGVQTFLHEVRDRLRSRTFVPTPVRQVMIPKASGKLRALGIPTVTDRVVQAALKIVLEPILPGRLPVGLLRFPAEQTCAGRDRRDPPLHDEVVRVGVGGRYRGVFRQHRPRRVDGSASAQDR